MLPSILSLCKRLRLIVLGVLLFAALLFPPLLHAADSPGLKREDPPVGVGANWVESPVVTEVGKSAERARQLLFWVFSHPPVYQAPVLASMWGVTRNVAYALVFITIIMFAFGFVLAQRRGIPLAVNLTSILFKIGGILLFVTFSYILILLLIQFSEILMRFFIEQVGGKDLFNIVFSDQQNAEKNYTNFVGFWDASAAQRNLEMRNASIFLIRTTTLTYNVMSIMLILRHIILWFLLIVSPFLALLMPFILIRNTGWIWIGVFFQWIFYGPLFAIFLAALTKIWVSGIPYPFDFERVKTMVGKNENTVYPTSINILYGGPAQTLSFNNSSNYVDTYAEYVISLLMLWVVTFLPWLLLRIFRDYCCEILAQNNAVLTQILDRIRGLGTPPPPPPTGGPIVAGQAIELPFRKAMELPQQAMMAKLAELQKSQTREIAQALSFSVSSLADIAEFEMSQMKQNQAQSNLDALANPESVADRDMRSRFSNLKSELSNRAARGDMTAKRVLAAAERRGSLPAGMVARPITTPDVAQRVGVSEKKVQEVLAAIPTMGIPSSQTVSAVSQKTGVPANQVQQILATARPAVARVPSAPAPVTVDDYEEVKSMWVSHYRDAEVPVSENIASRQQWLEEDIKKLTNVLNLLASADAQMKQKGIDEVGAILPFLLLGGFSDTETIMYLKAKLAAAKQIQGELEAQEKGKTQAKVEAEKEEELIEVGKGEKKEESKTVEAKQALSQELPKEEKKGEKKLP